MLAALSLAAACGGGRGGGDGEARPQTTASAEPPLEPPQLQRACIGTVLGCLEPAPELPQLQQACIETVLGCLEPAPELPQLQQACIETVLGCLEPAQYAEEQEAIEAAHEGEDDFRSQWGLKTIRADKAYARLELKRGIDTAPGAGQTVGMIDTGLDTGHPVFAGKKATEVLLVSVNDRTNTRRMHGTAAASIIVGRRDATFSDPDAEPAHGIAWGADVTLFATLTGIDNASRSLAGGDTSLLDNYDAIWKKRIDTVLDWSRTGQTLDFVNVGLTLGASIEQYSEQELRDHFGDAIAALAQASEDDRTVFVFVAGNGHGLTCNAADFTDNPDLCVDGQVNGRSVDDLPGLAARIPELRAHTVAVVAVGEDGDIASFSNRCGIAARWCIAAPGVNIRVAYVGPDPDDRSRVVRGVDRLSGTSFAAPMVTGSLIVMKHYFRGQLSNTGLLSRLLETANDRGIYADSAVYGHGMLDLDAALSPQGETRVSLGGRVDGSGIDLTRTRLALGGALGDGLTRSLAGREIAAFDNLGAPFWYSLGAFARSAEGPAPMTRLQGFMARPKTDRDFLVWRPTLGAVESGFASAHRTGLRLGILDAPAQDAGTGHLSLAGQAPGVVGTAGGLGVAAFSTEGLEGRAPVSGAMLSWRPEGAPFGLRGGLVGERETMLGSRSAGAFGRMGAGSAFVGLEGSAKIGGWRLGGGAEVGTVKASARGGLIADLLPLTTSAFALRTERSLDEEGAGFTLSLSQPLRVEAGHARLSVPVGRTREGQVLRRSVAADLEPTGRQIEVSAAWRRPVGPGSTLRLGAVWTRHPGHAAARDPDLTLLAGWHHTF